MSKKGSNTTADFLDFDSTMAKSMKILRNGGANFKIAFLAIVGLNVGLRIGDLLSLRHQDLDGEDIVIIEKKTQKRRTIKINENIKEAYALYCQRLKAYAPENFLFISRKKSVFCVHQVNRLLKEMYGTKGKAISSHSLRKGFGRRVWENDNYSERSIVLLSSIYQHSSISTTKIYLSIQQEEINDVYLNL